MTRKTHIAAGIAATLPLLYVCPKYSVLGILGATLPDLDLVLGLKHRTITHSLIALFSSTLILLIFNKWIALVFFTNYLIHLILDSFTKMGVPWLYPWNKRYYGSKKIKTGGAEDLFILLLLIYLLIFILK